MPKRRSFSISSTPEATEPAFDANRRGSLYVGAAVAFAVLTLYIRTAARDIVVGDTPELMTAAVTLGVAHPPGYPLLTLLGHAFSILPLQPVAFRMNLMAALCGAGAVWLIYLTSWQLTRSAVAAAIVAVALAVSPLFWSWSLVFEAFSLNNVLAAGLIYLLVIWDTQPGRIRYLIAAAFVASLAAANHQTIVLLVPATLFLVWRRRQDLFNRPGAFAGCAAAIVLGLLPYAYIPWAAARHPYLSWGDVSSLSDLIGLFLRSDYGTGRLVAAADFQGGSPVARVVALTASFPLLTALLAVAGVPEGYRRARNYFWFVMLAFVVAGPAFIAYANMDLSRQGTGWVLERFFLLSHVVAAPLVAFGVQSLARFASIAVAAPMRAPIRTGLAVLALVGIVLPAIRRYREVDQSSNHVAARYARDVLDSTEPGSLLLATGDEHGSPLAYAQAVEGKRTDVTLVLAPLLKAAWYVRLLAVRHPDLVLPQRSDPALITLKDVVDANRQRRIAVVGPAIDKSLEGSYGYIRHGLVSRVEPVTKTFTLATIAADNDALLRQYQPPLPAAINRRTFEPQLLRSYAAPAEWIGMQYKQARHNAEAATWYRRALQIDPDYLKAQQDLAEVVGK